MPSTISKRPAGRACGAKPNSEMTPSTSTNSSGFVRAIIGQHVSPDGIAATIVAERASIGTLSLIQGTNSSGRSALPTMMVRSSASAAATRLADHMTIYLGILLALACAFTTNLAFLYKHRGACAAPAVHVHHPLRSARDLFRSRWFAIGMLVAVGAWMLHVAALALAPMSVVQAVLAGGVVLLAVMAERIFGFRSARASGSASASPRSGSCCSASRCRTSTAPSRSSRCRA